MTNLFRYLRSSAQILLSADVTGFIDSAPLKTSKTETVNGNSRRESETESSSKALSLETLLADHLLLIAYEDRRGGSGYIKNEINQKNGNQDAHEELMRSPAVLENP
ncbi:hypothetical protein F2Q70_00038995 [Brassica cretica]|uniref:Uncharacterized protein n=1 Tax=Brassica cretica TaxID=69181 RepID=A0A8S9KBE6_BRACR|nr:hypothetical protein F2Q70_00038995 [Brassica cretica]